MEFNKLIPELSVTDYEKSLAFYKMLGFKVEYTRENFAFLSLQGSQLMIEKQNDTWNVGELTKPFGRGINFQIAVNNVEEILSILKENNYEIAFPLEVHTYVANDEEFHEKEFLVQDPNGYLLRFSQTL
ncbi:MAG: VOC family protein [Candidatus Diapherotrites archaeon]|jgi:catechol 2,3-dioxygenase-like lactoylglutathione lyase family enzyme|uniref:Bleomycin resistance protein n=1 Tax=Candidatus Iainarchaeum sp. TaxID=3101447 RepID=A0A8T5GDI7_9ARCH|nr:VOC family protein [Candidatus Diapherotrites archaeon]MBT7241428.1 VOC family protein [Candidatus Diapherotrites archaeon]